MGFIGGCDQSEVTWPEHDAADRIKACHIKSGWLNTKANAVDNVPNKYKYHPVHRNMTKPCWMSDHEVKRHEKTFTPNIISIEDILYLKTSDCQLEVKESNAM